MLLSIKLYKYYIFTINFQLNIKRKNMKALLQKNGFIHYQSDML